MGKDVRLFNCARCHQQSLICPCCDRGNIYCLGCAKTARKESVKAAGRRYQNTRQGRFKHAARQRRYRQRQKEKVTHQGSPISGANDLLPPELSDPDLHPRPVTTRQLQCHFCHKNCSGLMRLGFMQRHPLVQKQRKMSWPHEP